MPGPLHHRLLVAPSARPVAPPRDRRGAARIASAGSPHGVAPRDPPLTISAQPQFIPKLTPACPAPLTLSPPPAHPIQPQRIQFTPSSSNPPPALPSSPLVPCASTDRGGPRAHGQARPQLSTVRSVDASRPGRHIRPGQHIQLVDTSDLTPFSLSAATEMEPPRAPRRAPRSSAWPCDGIAHAAAPPRRLANRVPAPVAPW